jgi:predicted amidophosphoribosyltransferase
MGKGYKCKTCGRTIGPYCGCCAPEFPQEYGYCEECYPKSPEFIEKAQTLNALLDRLDITSRDLLGTFLLNEFSEDHRNLFLNEIWSRGMKHGR